MKDFEGAKTSFESILSLSKQTNKSIVIYNALIDAYVEMGQHKNAREVLKEAQDQNIQPDSITIGIFIKMYSYEGQNLFNSFCRPSHSPHYFVSTNPVPKLRLMNFKTIKR